MHLKKLAKEEIMMTNYSKKTNFKGYEKLKTESLTFQELKECYFKDRRNARKSTTVQNDKYCLEKFSSLNDRDILSLEPQDFLDILDEMDQKGLKASYINKVRSVVHKVMLYAVNENYLLTNPVSKVAIYKKPDEIKEEMRVWTFNDFNKFISEIDQVSDKKYYLLFNLLYYTGCRKGEVLALKWEDIDFHKKTIKINKTVSQQLRGCNFKLTAPKTKNSVRVIRMTDYLATLLEDHYKIESKVKKFTKNYFVLGGEKPLGLRYIGDKFRDYSIKAEVPLIRIHDLRHSHASLLINNGANIKAIAARLGDNVDTVLNVYTHLFHETEEELVNIIERVTATK